MSSVKAFVDEKIKNYKVAVFSKSYCPYCHKAKNALESFAYKPNTFYWLEIEDRPDCQEIQDYLNSITGGRFVFFQIIKSHNPFLYHPKTPIPDPSLVFSLTESSSVVEMTLLLLTKTELSKKLLKLLVLWNKNTFIG